MLNQLGPANRLAIRTLLRNPLRTILMATCVAIGVGALTALNVVGESTRVESIRRFKNMLGSFDTVMVRPGAARTRGMVSLTTAPPTLKFEDASAVAGQISGIRQIALLQNAFDVEAKYRDRSDPTAVFGVSANWQQVRGETIAEGRFINEEDIASRARVAVLGADVVATLYTGASPIGSTIRIGEVPFLVIGTVPSRGAGPVGASLDDIILIPVTTAASRLFNRDYLTMIVAQLADPERAESVIRDIREMLRARHHLAASALDDFTLTSPAVMMKTVGQLKSTLGMLLRGVGAGATVIACLVVFGLMLASVARRRAEIGISRATGATRAGVLSQFVLEAAWATAAGGLLGLAAGALIAIVITRVEGLGLVIAAPGLMQSLGQVLAIACVGGLYPAWRAAAVDPVMALRT